MKSSTTLVSRSGYFLTLIAQSLVTVGLSLALALPSLAQPINITSEWLGQNGPAPYLLTSANSTYLLQTDLTVEGTAFIVGAENVILDLNGHTITYGNAAPLSLTNGGFESGSARNVPGWNLNEAPAAAIAPNDRYMWGNQLLKFTDISTAQTIISDTIAIPTPNREYAATVTPKGPSDSKVTLTVLNGANDEILASGVSSAVNRGFAAVATFTPDATVSTVKLKIQVEPAADKTQTVYLDYVSLTHGRDHGVVASGNSSGYWPSHLLPYASHSRLARNTIIKNGAIIQGQADRYLSHAIWAGSTKQNFTVDNTTIFVAGINSVAIHASTDSFYGVGQQVFTNNKISADVTKITNRMHQLAMVAVGASTVIIQKNQIRDHPQVGIAVTGGSGHTVSSNFIDSNAIATNCYGIALGGVHNTKVFDNTISTARSGRGIIVDGLTGHSQDSVNLQIFNNHIDIMERPSLEYGTGFEATALRLRSYRSGGHRGFRIYDNTFIARSADTHNRAALGLRVSYVNNEQIENWDNILSNNIFRAIVDSTNSSYWARAVTLEGLSALTNLKFIGNRFESNHISLGLGGNDGANAYDASFISNSFVKSDQGAARQYQTVLAGAYNGDINRVSLIDNRYDGGATDEIVFSGMGTKEIGLGSLLTVQVQNNAGSPLAGAVVEVFDRENQRVFSGSSDIAGKVADIALVTALLSQSGSAASSSDQRGPHRVEVALSNRTAQQTINLTNSTSLTLVLDLPDNQERPQAPQNLRVRVN